MYPATPVDCLISELREMFGLGGHTPMFYEEFEERVQQFKREVDGPPSSQFPRPLMQEIGRSPDDPKNDQWNRPAPNTVSVTCKRGHTTYGYVNYCPTCGTKFFRCPTCGQYICFDKQHAHAEVAR